MERVVICMKWGTLYGPDYVNVLFNAVRKNLTGPFRFVCLTDRTDGLLPEIEAFPIPYIGCSPEMWRHGAWPKLSVFAEDLYGVRGRVLYIDMDTVISGPLEHFFEFDAPFVAIDTSDNWSPSGEPGSGAAQVENGVFAFDLGAQAQTLSKFQENPKAAFDTWQLEQVWVQKTVSSLAYWPRDWVISFKRWLRQPIGLDLFRKPRSPSADTSFVAFHGTTRPIALVRKRSGFWDKFPHMGYGQVRWMQEYWTQHDGRIPE